MLTRTLAFVAALCAGTLPAFAQTVPTPISVTTWGYNNARTGNNANEFVLTPANVNPSTFGKIFSYGVDGYVYAEPLLLPGLTLAGGAHDVVFVATEHDSVYAFDAAQNQLLWQASLLDAAHGALPGATTVPSDDVGTHDIVPEIGITSTPVIDPATNTLYVVAKSKENGQYFNRLHALDALTGNERANSPVAIQPSVPGNGSGSVNGTVTFQPQWQLNRAGLLFAKGYVYVGFASHGDNGPYHGWIVGYNASTLQQAGVFNTTPNGGEAGIWQSGAGLAADTSGDGRMFFATGNGENDAIVPYTSSQNYGEAIVDLSLASGGLQPIDQWTPFDWANLNAADIDQASGGVLILPDQPGAHPHELVQVGKNGRIELLDRDYLGGTSPNTNNVVQELYGQIGGLWSTPAYWNGNIYLWGNNDTLKQFTLTDGLLSTSPIRNFYAVSHFPGATPVVSSSGNSNAIVWALRTDGYSNGSPAILYALDATDVSRLLYSTTQNPNRDNAGKAVKFVSPVVANGRVYISAQGEVDVYGELALALPTASTPAFSLAPGTYTSAQTLSLSDGLAAAAIHYTTDGSIPTAASPLYAGAITINSSTTVQAIATAAGYANSSVLRGTFTIGTPPTLDFSNGFASVAGLSLNGSAVHTDDSRLQITTGSLFQAGSAFSTQSVNVQAFTTDFTFQLSGTAPIADGITFTIQKTAPTALGGYGINLGYGGDAETPGIAHSVALKLDVWNNQGEGSNSTGLYMNGASPTIPSVDITPSGLNLAGGSTLRAHITYNGTTLSLTLTDPVTGAVFNKSFPINIPQTIGSNTAFVGFTGGTGGATASQKILTWGFTSTPPSVSPTLDFGNGFASATGLTLNGSTVNPSTGPLQITTGQQFQAGSAFSTSAVNIQGFTTDFDFQISGTAPLADGITFTMENTAPNALGPNGGGLAYGSEDGAGGGIAHSVAVKFDLWNNFGEGSNSTGVYVNGALPATPSSDLTASGVNLASGHPLHAHITYDGSNLNLTLTDTVTGAVFTLGTPINIPQVIGSNTAFVGFTGGTGAYVANQNILDWTFRSNPSPVIDLSNGFASTTGLTLNGSAANPANGPLNLTTGAPLQSGSAFTSVPVNIQTFTTDFTFQITGTAPLADGLTFTLQNTAPTALGALGGGLGFGTDNGAGSSIPQSVAVKFDLWNNQGEGSNSTGVYTNGVFPTTPSTDLTPSGVNLARGNPLHAHLTYDGITLHLTLTDTVTGAVFTSGFPINIPQVIGSNTAFAGFTAGTGGYTAVQQILNWTLTANGQ